MSILNARTFLQWTCLLLPACDECLTGVSWNTFSIVFSNSNDKGLDSELNIILSGAVLGSTSNTWGLYGSLLASKLTDSTSNCRWDSMGSCMTSPEHRPMTTRQMVRIFVKINNCFNGLNEKRKTFHKIFAENDYNFFSVNTLVITENQF